MLEYIRQELLSSEYVFNFHRFLGDYLLQEYKHSYADGTH